MTDKKCSTTLKLQPSVISNFLVSTTQVCEILYGLMAYVLCSLKNYKNCLYILFSKSWKRNVKLSGPSWMEDTTTYSALWLHAWDWRKLMWKMPRWRGIRFILLQIDVFFCKEYPAALKLKQRWEEMWPYLHFWINIATSILFELFQFWGGQELDLVYFGWS